MVKQDTNTKQQLGKTILYVTIIICFGKLMGFLRGIFLAEGFGTSQIVDSFLMSESVSAIFLGWLISFSITFVPLYTSIKEERGTQRADQFTATLLVFVEAFCFFCVLLTFFLHEFLIALSAPGFSSDARILTAEFFKIVVWTNLFSVPATIFCAYLNCNNKKNISSLTILILGVFQLGSVICANVFQNSSFLPWGIFAAYCAQFVYLFVIATKNRFYFSIKKEFFYKIYKTVALTLPVFLGNMITEIEVFVDRIFSSLLAEGAVSILHYADRIRILFSYIFSSILLIVFYPDLSRLAASGDHVAFKKYFSTSIEVVLFIFLPLTAGCIALAEPAISFVYERGAFSGDALAKATSVFIFYSLSLAPIALRDLMIRALYAMQITKYSIYFGVITVLCNIILNTIFMNILEINGIALATSLSSVISVFLYIFAINKIIGNVIDKNILNTVIKCCIASGIMGAFIYWGYCTLALYTDIHNKLLLLGSILISVFLGIILYILLCLLLKVKITKKILQMILRRRYAG